MLSSLCVLFRVAGEHHFEQALEGLFGDGYDFTVGTILDWVRNEQRRGVGAQCARLCLRTVDKLRCGDIHRGNTALFEINRVVHTARRTAASIR